MIVMMLALCIIGFNQNPQSIFVDALLQTMIVVVVKLRLHNLRSKCCVHSMSVLHLNINQFVFSCSPGMIGMRYT